MKYIVYIAMILATITGTVSAATGSTSGTGSTSTGSTLSGVTLTGIIVPSCTNCGAGGPVSAYNYTAKKWDLLPQCFPWAWLVEYYKGNIFMIYENQRICREARRIDFGF